MHTTLGQTTVFSTLDASSGYWQAGIDDVDKEKNAFTSHHGLYRFVHMPFGLHNAPRTIPPTMNLILSSVKWQFALVYLDDIVVVSKTAHQGIDLLHKVLSLLHSAGVILKPKKGKFVTGTIDCLGPEIRPRRLKLPFHTADVFRGLQIPTNLTKLRSSLGSSKRLLTNRS